MGAASAAQRSDHSSRSRIAPGLQQPTRGSPRCHFLKCRAYGPGQPSPPIWPCSTRGFPSLARCRASGGLLPHLFTLTKRAQPEEAGPRSYLEPAAEVFAHRRFIFCGTFRSREAGRSTSRNPLALPGALPCCGRLSRVHHDRSPDFPPAHPSSRSAELRTSRRSPDSPADAIIRQAIKNANHERGPV
jgi:hypothetical protein